MGISGFTKHLKSGVTKRSRFGRVIRLKERFEDRKIAAMSGGAICAIDDRKVLPRGSANCPLDRRQNAPSNNQKG